MTESLSHLIKLHLAVVVVVDLMMCHRAFRVRRDLSILVRPTPNEHLPLEWLSPNAVDPYVKMIFDLPWPLIWILHARWILLSSCRPAGS